MRARQRVFCHIFIALAVAAFSPARAEQDKPPATAPPTSIVINLPALRLYLYRGDELLHDYAIAVGKPETPTPQGDFRLVCIVRDPTWYPKGKKPVPPGPDNPLGRWWLGLDIPGYGIHGCLDETSIGRAVSNGCIRLHNRDIEHLARQVRVGTRVRIVYWPFLLRTDLAGGLHWLWLGRDIYRRHPDLVEEALLYLERNAVMSWDAQAARSVLARAAPGGWTEVPRPIEVRRREVAIAAAYCWEGRIWFSREAAGRLPGGAALAAGGEEVDLEELAAAGGGSVDWRFDPGTMALTAYPARIRRGVRVWEDAVKRTAEGRIMVRKEAMAAALGLPLPAIAGHGEPGGERDGDWLPLDEVGTHRVYWDAEAWEVVVE